MAAPRLYSPKYDHIVWNRTDLVGGAGNSVTGPAANLSVAYAGAKPPLINAVYPPQLYRGEIIPPFAAMRILTNPIWYGEHLCWIVCRPDDHSMAHQAAGVHFFNGASPIPVGKFGLATNDLPAPVLCDITLDVQIPYGNATSGVAKTSTGAEWLGTFMGFASGDWALHPAGDLISYGANTWLAVDTGLPGGQATMTATKFPYCIAGQHPLNPTKKTPGPTDSPTLAFNYSDQIFWVGEGSIGFGSVGISG